MVVEIVYNNGNKTELFNDHDIVFGKPLAEQVYDFLHKFHVENENDLDVKWSICNDRDMADALEGCVSFINDLDRAEIDRSDLEIVTW